jgi:hypothetical protein
MGGPRVNSSNLSAAAAFLDGYVKTLNDPFEYPAVKLGYDCFVPSDLATAYARGSQLTNADGSLALIMLPQAGNTFGSYNIGGLNSTTWSSFAATNSTNLLSNYGSARVVSGGVRAFALQAATSAPGVIFAGTIPIATKAQLLALAPIDLVNLPQSNLGIGSTGAQSLMRPQDNDSFVFWAGAVSSAGFASMTQLQMSIPYIVFMGFPASTPVWYEFILNMETLTRIGTSDMGNSNAPVLEPVASDFFPSPENLFSKIKTLVSDAAVMDAAENAAGIVSPSLAKGISIARSFGRSTHSRKVAAGIARQKQLSREASIELEEIIDSRDAL